MSDRGAVCRWGRAAEVSRETSVAADSRPGWAIGGSPKAVRVRQAVTGPLPASVHPAGSIAGESDPVGGVRCLPTARHRPTWSLLPCPGGAASNRVRWFRVLGVHAAEDGYDGLPGRGLRLPSDT